MLSKEQEKILEYLLSIERNSNNQISIGRYNYSLRNIAENDFISYLHLFEKSGLIELHWHSPHHDNLICFVDITLLPDAINYFKVKKSNKKKTVKEDIKWLIPLIISILSLICSIYSIMLSMNAAV